MKALYFLKLYLYFIIDIHANDIKGQTALQEPLQETVVPDPPGIPAIRRPPFLNSCNRTGLCPGLGQRGNDQVVDTPQVGLLWGVGTDTRNINFPQTVGSMSLSKSLYFMYWDKSQLPMSFVWGWVGQLSGAHRSPVFNALLTLLPLSLGYLDWLIPTCLQPRWRIF